VALSQLSNGIGVLCGNDSEIERIIGSRKKETEALLERFLKEIELFNSAYSLVGTNDPEEIVIRHILDSLAPLGIISGLLNEETAQIADAGSGAGFPGIPLAIAMPQHKFALIERMGRRAGFLYNTCAILAEGGITNISIEENEFEKTERDHFSLVTFRAFKGMDAKLLKALLNACKNTGVIAAYKGRLETIKKEMLPLEKKGVKWEAIPYNVPFLEEERHLLVIRK